MLLGQKVSFRDLERSMAEGITAISVRGYRSLAVECMVEVHPLTILTGPNGSGKSSIMEPLMMMKQTLEASFDPGPLQIFGPNIRSSRQEFSRQDQFLFRRCHAGSFTVRLEYGFGASTLEETFAFRPGIQDITIEKAVYTDMGEVTTLCKDMTHDHLASFMPRWQEENRRILEDNLGRPVQWTVARERCFLLPKAVSGSQGEDQHFSFSLPSEPFDLALRRLIHVPALRGREDRPRRAVLSDQFFPGNAEAQAALARVMAEAAGRGARIIVETHSGSLIDGVRALVAGGMLATEMTRLCHFKKMGDGTSKVISSSP